MGTIHGTIGSGNYFHCVIHILNYYVVVYILTLLRTTFSGYSTTTQNIKWRNNKTSRSETMSHYQLK